MKLRGWHSHDVQWPTAAAQSLPLLVTFNTVINKRSTSYRHPYRRPLLVDCVDAQFDDNPVHLTITMRFAAAAVALYATVASARGLSFFGHDQDVIINEAQKVPGDSPLEFCDTDHSDDIATIESVDLSPNPPSALVSLLAMLAARVAADS
jgi:hypothetical protein